MRLIGPALAAAVALAPSPATAEPAIATAQASSHMWSPTQQLNIGTVVDDSEPVPFSSDPAVGVAADGAALASWSVARVRGQEPADVHVAAAPAGGRFAAERTVLPEAQDPRVVVLRDSRALLAARTRSGWVLAAGRVDGTFGAPRPLTGAREVLMTVVPTPQGALALTYVEDDRGFQRARVRDIAPDGGVGPARDAGLGFSEGEGLARGADGTLAFPVGRTVVVRRPDGRWVRLPSPLPRDAASVAAGVAPDGRISVAGLVDVETGEGTAYGAVAVAEWRPGARRFGPVRRPPMTARSNALDGGLPRAWAFDPAVAYDARGRRTVSWVEDTHPDPGAEAESEVGEGIVWSGGRRTRIAARTGVVALAGRRDGVLAVAARGGR